MQTIFYVVVTAYPTDNNNHLWGASTTANPKDSDLSSNYWLLPSGTKLPNGLGFEQGAHYHGTIFPTQDMTEDEFNTLYNSLPWQSGGHK